MERLKTITEPNLVSTGKLCEILQRGPSEIAKALAAMNAQPILRLNGLSYWGEDVIAPLSERLTRRKATGGTKP